MYAPARWHSAGHPIVYTAQSLSLAALEFLVRLKQTNDIQPFYAYSMEIPDHLILTPKFLPARWRSRIAVSRAFGDAWLKTNNLPALRVPTVITPGEWNVLVNRLHPQFSLKWIVTGPDACAFDARLLERDSVSKNATGSMTPREFWRDFSEQLSVRTTA